MRQGWITMNYWRAAASFGAIVAALDAAFGVLTSGLHRGWGTIGQSDFWMERAFVGASIFVAFTAFRAARLRAEANRAR